jgi:hypothetical protein
MIWEVVLKERCLEFVAIDRQLNVNTKASTEAGPTFYAFGK